MGFRRYPYPYPFLYPYPSQQCEQGVGGASAPGEEMKSRALNRVDTLEQCRAITQTKTHIKFFIEPMMEYREIYWIGHR